jgi:hypothetical protein
VAGDWAFLFSTDGVQQNAAPYLCTSIEQGPDGRWYARFLETDTGWLVEQCKRADAPAAPPGTDAGDEVLEVGTQTFGDGVAPSPPDMGSPVRPTSNDDYEEVF